MIFGGLLSEPPKVTDSFCGKIYWENLPLPPLSWGSCLRKSFFWLSRNILIIINFYFGWIERKLMNVSSTKVFAVDFKVRRRARKINVELFGWLSALCSLGNNYHFCSRHRRELALLSRQSIWRFPSVQVDNCKSIIHKSKKRHLSSQKTFTRSFLPYNSYLTSIENFINLIFSTT